MSIHLPRRRPLSLLLAAMAMAAAAPKARAATTTYDWDASGGAPLNDGAGNWNATGGTNWFNTAASTYGAWSTTPTLDEAVFGVGSGAAGTVTVGTVTANKITFNAPGSGNYTLSGGTITLGGATPTITANADATISSKLGGGAGLTKAGSGTLTLSGANNYTGATAVNAGTLNWTGGTTLSGLVTVNNNGTFGMSGSALLSGGITVNSGGVFNWNTSSFVDANHLNIGTITVNGGTFNITNSRSVSFGANDTLFNNQVLTGNGTINQTGGGVVDWWTGTNISGFSGTYNVQNGILSSQGSSAADMTTTATVNLTATTGFLDLRTQNFGCDKLTGGGTVGSSWTDGTHTLTVGTNNGTSQFDGVIQNGGISSGTNAIALTKTGTGTLTLTGANTYTGATTISGGTLQIGDGTNPTNWSYGGSFGDTASGPGTLSIAANSTLTMTGAVNNRLVRANGSTLAIAGTLAVSGGSAQSLTNGNTSAATVVLNNGTMTTNGTGNSIGSFFINGNITITANGANNLISGINTVGMNAGTLTMATLLATDQLTVSTNLLAAGGTGNLTKSGAGTLVLSGANTYTGNTTISGGTLKIVGAGALGWNGSVGSYAGAIAINGGTTFQYSSSATQTLATISGTGTFLKDDAAATTLTVNTASGFSGSTTVNTGKLLLNNTYLNGGTVSVASGATLQIDGASNRSMGGGATISYQGAGTIQKAGSGQVDLSWNQSGNTVAMSSGSKIDVQGGTLRLGFGGNLTWTNNKSDLNVASGATFDLWDCTAVRVNNLTGSGTVGRGIATTGTLTVGVDNGTGAVFSGTISNASGTTSLTKTGTGTQTLSGANTYAGATTVNAGTLELDFSQAGAPTANIINNSSVSSALVLGGGTLLINGASSGTNTQAFNNISGNGVVTLAQNGTTLLNATVGAVSGSVDFHGANTTVAAGLASVGTANIITTTHTQDSGGGNKDNGTQRLGTSLWTDGTGSYWASTASTIAGGGGTIYVVQYAGPYINLTTDGAATTSNIGDLRITDGGGSATAITYSSGSANTTINSLLMAASTHATTVDIAAGTTVTLKSNNGADRTVAIGGSAQSLTLGSTANQGTLTADTAGTLSLNNLNTASTLTVNSVIANNGGNTVALSTVGTVVLNATNTYTGSTTITSGTLQIAGAGSLGSGTYAGAISGSGTLEYSSSATQTFSGAITGALSLHKDTSSSTLTLSGSNSYSGATTVDAGTLAWTGSGTLGGLVTVNSGGTYQMSGSANLSGGINVNSGGTFTWDLTTRAVDQGVGGKVNIGVLNVASGGTVNISNTKPVVIGTNDVLFNNQVLQGSGTVNQSGGGVVDWWSGTNLSGFSGTYNVQNGILTIQGDTAAAMTTTAAVNLTATTGFLDLRTQDFGCDKLTGGGVVGSSYTQAHTLTVGTNNGSSTFDGVIKNGGISTGTAAIALTKTGTGTLTLTGNNTYTGATTVSGGTLQIAGSGTLGWNGTNGAYAGNITDNATLQYSSSANQTLSGVVSGTGALIKDTGSGTLTLTNAANSYTGLTTVSAGTLEVTANNALGTNAAGTTVASGGTLKLTNVNYTTTEALSINGTGAGGAGAILNSGTSTYAGAVTIATNATINNGGGTLNLTGGVNKTGTTVTFSGAGTTNIGGTGNGLFGTGGAPNSDVVINGVGLGTTVNLNVASFFNGNVSVTNTSSLFVNANLNTVDNLGGGLGLGGTGTVAVDGTSRLGGFGSITTASLSVAGGGQITGGAFNSLSGTAANNILHITTTTGGMVLQGTYLADINYTGQSGNQADGVRSDVVSVTGNVDLTGATLALTGTDTPAAAGSHYAIKLFEVDAGSTITGDWASVTFNGSSLAPNQSVVRWGNAYYLVPEPASFALLGLGGLLLLRRPSRRRGRAA